MDKYKVKLRSLTLLWQLVKKNGNHELKPVKLQLNHEFVSYPTRMN